MSYEQEIDVALKKASTTLDEANLKSTNAWVYLTVAIALTRALCYSLRSIAAAVREQP